VARKMARKARNLLFKAFNDISRARWLDNALVLSGFS